MSAKKRKCLTLEERMKVVKLLDGGKSCRAVASELGVGKTQIQTIQKRKREIQEEYDSDSNVQMKRPRRATEFDDVNELTYKWFLDATSRQLPVSGPMLRERALKFAKDLNVSFKASNGWLESFLRRHNIVFKTQSGERAEVNQQVVSEWKARLPSLCEGYSPKDVFNMDESGLFYRSSTRSTYFKKGEKCAGGKQSKERITVGLCASATGEKLPPIVIAKSKKPRCFGSITHDQLPVKYYYNKKAWMQTSIMEDWLKWFDRRMGREKRKVLLFLDNAPCHPKVTLQNVKLQFLPANTTSVCQPMDQGIIQAMKLKYRNRQLKHVNAELEKSALSGPQILRDINVLQAIHWVNSAWNETSVETITKCFKNSGFFNVESCSEIENCDDGDDSDDCDDDFPLIMHKLAHELFDCEVRDLIHIDSEFVTCDNDMSSWDRPASEILADNDEDSEDEAEDITCVKSTEQNLTLDDACNASTLIQSWALKNGDMDIMNLSMKISDYLNTVRMQKNSAKQSKISDFFVKK